MAHEIDFSTGKAAVAWTNETPWHGLGQKLDENSSIETWVEAAQMNWDVMGSPVQFITEDGFKQYTGQQVLFRSDTKDPLSVVSSEFKVVQPREVLEFFRDLVELYDMKLSVAGCLFGGKRFWATAETGRVADILPGDEVRGQLLLMTGVDGTLATSAKFVSTRVVCNNTLQLAMGENGGREVRRTHRQSFDPRQVKIDLGLLDNAWTNHIELMQRLTKVKMTSHDAFDFYKSLLASKQEKEDNELKRSTQNAVEELMYRMANGLGADYGRGTAWNVLNAVTEKYTHGTSRRDPNRQFVNSVYGSDSNIKTKAVEKLAELV